MVGQIVTSLPPKNVHVPILGTFEFICIYIIYIANIYLLHLYLAIFICNCYNYIKFTKEYLCMNYIYIANIHLYIFI